MIGRLHTDSMLQERYMMNGVDMRIRLIPSKLMAHVAAAG